MPSLTLPRTSSPWSKNEILISHRMLHRHHVGNLEIYKLYKNIVTRQNSFAFASQSILRLSSFSLRWKSNWIDLRVRDCSQV